jgi:phosphogluconate dehydratase
MPLDDRISAVTDRIIDRSKPRTYLDRMRRLAEEGPRRAHLSCGNQAHAYAAMGATRTRSSPPGPEPRHRHRL